MDPGNIFLSDFMIQAGGKEDAQGSPDPFIGRIYLSFSDQSFFYQQVKRGQPREDLAFCKTQQ